MGARETADTLEKLPCFDGTHHFRCILIRKGSNAEGNILQHFDKHTAETEHNHRAVLRIGGETAHHFARALHHFLNQNAFKAFIESALSELRDQIAVFTPEGFLRGDADTHAAHVSLVGGGFRRHLHHDRVTDRIRDSDCLILCLRKS